MIEFIITHPELSGAAVILLVQLISHFKVKGQLHQIHIIVNDRTDRMMAEIERLRTLLRDEGGK